MEPIDQILEALAPLTDEEAQTVLAQAVQRLIVSRVREDAPIPELLEDWVEGAWDIWSAETDGG